MMSNMPTIFNFKDREVRVVMVNNEPWFVAKDVCEVLEIKNHRDATARLKNSMKRAVGVTDAIGRVQETTVINEAGVYKITFASTKPEAEKFTDWLAEEVIPSIRKTGSYSVQSNNVVPLSEERALITVLRTTADLLEGQEELWQGQQQLEMKLAEVDRKVEEQITLNSHEQRKVQKEIAKRVYELAEQIAFKQLCFDGTEEIVPDLEKERRKLFSEIHRAIKDCFAVPSYRDVRRSEFNQLLLFIQVWRPRLVA
ncbi:BRO family protein [Aneurinibacillus thermoaerophilus]|uniref:ORF6C domain-containing protein n=1 Tax=Aneurinibacillus thermoaerophilus TaxID=143495 RepID=A0ABX8Y8Y8_ANETH|nr:MULTISPECIES: BRO family protein [Aneurinibacillus]QYY41488.1 ORF6C domain-containing protein [Aneurinibacillus thermoaerophilus]